MEFQLEFHAIWILRHVGIHPSAKVKSSPHGTPARIFTKPCASLGYSSATANYQDFHAGTPFGLVPKMPHAGEDHRQAMLVGGLDDFIVTHGPTRLNDRRDAGFCRGVDAITKREERI